MLLCFSLLCSFHSIVVNYILLGEVDGLSLSLTHVMASDQTHETASDYHLQDVLLLVETLGSQIVPFEVLSPPKAAGRASLVRLAAATLAEKVVEEGYD